MQTLNEIRPRQTPAKALLAAALSFEVFQGTTECEFRKWIISILQNQIVDVRRFHRQAERRDVRKQQVLESDTAIGAFDSTGESDNAESIDQLLSAIENLPADLQDIVRSRYLEGLSFDEIAERNERSRETARRRWKDAIFQLGKLLKADNL